MPSEPSASTNHRPEVVVFDDPGDLVRAAAERIRAAARDAIAARGRFRIALAGGTTPRALYPELAQGIDWTRAQVFFGDERAVPADDPRSNYHMAWETLLAPAAVPAENVFRWRTEDPDLDAAAREYERALAAAGSPPWLDLDLLGLGPDGHTASLFPGTTAVEERARACVAVDVPQLRARRLTLTVPVLSGATEVAFLIAGREKAEALRDVLGETDCGRQHPAQLIMRRPGPVVIFCDRAAAALCGSLSPEVS